MSSVRREPEQNVGNIILLSLLSATNHVTMIVSKDSVKATQAKLMFAPTMMKCTLWVHVELLEHEDLLNCFSDTLTL